MMRILQKSKYTEEDLKKRLELAAALEQKVKLQEGLPHLYGWKWYKWAKEFFDSTNKQNFLTAANQVSKGHPDTSVIPTPTGFKNFGDLKIGDFVFSESGVPVEIIDFPWIGEDACYEVEFNDGTSTQVTKDHLWKCRTSEERFRKTYTNNRKGSKLKGTVSENKNYGSWVVKSTLELIKIGQYSPTTKRPYNRVAIPIAAPCEYRKKELPLDPYLLGLLLGDGGLTSGSVILTSSDPEIQDYAQLRHGAKKSGKYGFRLNGYQKYLRQLGLMGLGSKAKFIPEVYLQSSIEDRLELLKGLLDTDGTINKKSAVSFTTISPVLAGDISKLVCSLGGKTKTKIRKSGYKKNGIFTPRNDAFHVTIKIELNPFKLKRKASLFYKTRYAHERVILAIRPIGLRKARCISVAGDGTYLHGKNYVVTHNSSTLIRKNIHWATSPEIWPSLWRNPPRQFWYLYPTQDVVKAEFDTKWMQFMPANEYKLHPQYGWELEKGDRGRLIAIHFNSGINIYFKTYAQDASHLQSSTCDMISADEEMPAELYPELMFRLSASGGYFNMVFTATQGQEFWRLVMEPGYGEDEKLPEAAKWTVSMYDCMKYEDGTPTHWTLDKIKSVEGRCPNEDEIQRRVWGRFVGATLGGRMYEQFNPKKHLREPTPLPASWMIYAGIDIGSGGENHPAAICFTAVSPDYRSARVIKAWRGDNVTTTAADVLEKFRAMKATLPPITAAYYDWASRDFFNIATRAGETVLPADKSKDTGCEVLNVLFKNDMLTIDQDEETSKLAIELTTLRNTTKKTVAKDDLCDALRYSVSKIAFDWSCITGARPEGYAEPEVVLTPAQRELMERRKWFESGDKEVKDEVEREFEEWNALYE